MKNSFWSAIGLVTILSLVCTAALAVTPPYSENFEGGTAGNSVSTLGWRVTSGDVKIALQGYDPGWGNLCLNGGLNTTGVSYAFYDFTAPITSGQVSLEFDAWSVNYQVQNGEFGLVIPQYTSGHPGIRWIGGQNSWMLALPYGAYNWTYSGGGDQAVHLEVYLDLDANTVWGAITDSTGRTVTPVISDTTPSITALGYYGYKPFGHWDDYNVDNINLTAVPEPSVLFSLGTGLLTIAGFGLRRRAR